MNSANRVKSRLKTTKKRPSASEASHRRRMLFEPLEDRRLLALTAADFGAEGEGGLLPSMEEHQEHDHATGLQYSAPRHYRGSTTGFLTPPRAGAPLTVAMNYLRQNASSFGLTTSDINSAIVKSQYTNDLNGVTSIALRQSHNGLEVQAADILINVMSDGRILNASSTFVPNLQSSGTTAQASIGAAAAFSQFATEFGFELTTQPTVIDFEGGTTSKTLLSKGGLADQNVKAELVYVPVDAGGQPGIELAWNLNVQMLKEQHWYSASMSAEGGGALYFEDWVSNAQYNAVDYTNESPVDGTGRAILVDPADPQYSPFGWHDANGLPGADFFDTRGNNVDAQEDRNNNAGLGNPVPTIRPQGGPNLIFDAPLDLTQGPVAYTEAAITNLFVWNNISHDIFAKGGFTEEAGNFQVKNYSQRGLGGDPVLALAQVADAGAAAGNNAFMATPPDGFQPTMAMFTFDLDLSDFILDSANNGGIPPTYSPRRDSDLAVDVIVHEYSHGVTNRMTGGPANVGALNALQSGGLGEGWGDYFGLHMLQKATDLPTDAYPVGTYLMGPNPLTDTGIRRFPYSFDMSINPLTFVDFNGGGGAIPNDEVHNSGEIWAQTLWDMQWLLVEKYGFDPDLYNGTGGNNLAFQLVMTGLTLQVTNPSFLEARDAILQADLIHNQGVNQKEIWEAFARRGMGFSADDDITNGPIAATSNQVSAAFDLPPNASVVSGTVWADDNGNGIRDAGEGGIPNWEVFIDLNNNGLRGPQEPATVTDASGNYSFELYASTQLFIGETRQDNTSQTFPPNNDNHTVLINQNLDDVTGVDFGIRTDDVATHGFKFHDVDGDGRRDADEPGIEGIWLYVDYDGDSRLDLGEPAAVTQADGRYQLSIDRNGTFKVREVNVPGWIQTVPGGEDQAHTVTVTEGSLNLTLDFGNMKAVDYGDAPDTYGTTVAANGASHGMLAGLSLGTFFDVEADGLPSTNAKGDDNDGFPNDEDGVTFDNIFFPGSSSEITVDINTGINAPARLNAWFDFNRNGVFTDPGEQVISADRKATGEYTYVINVPADAVPGQTYARFRLGYESVIGPTGPAGAGEVEDYVVQLLNDRPDAIDDTAEIIQNSVANPIFVLANDISSFNGPIFVSEVGTPDRGGRVNISAAGDFVSYTPREDFFGNESFTYTISDQNGIMDTATVSVTILPPFDNPFAIDDSFEVTTNSSLNILDVLSNDIAGLYPSIELVDVTPAQLGFVTIDRAGTPDPEDDVLRYTPNPGVGGTDQFTYTIQNQRPEELGGPVQASTTVTVHIQPGDQANDLVQYRVDTTDLNGNSLTTIESGNQFLLKVYVQDLRNDDGDGDPVDRRGVAAAYLDVLYDFRLVSVAGDIVYGPEYSNVVSGNSGIPGLIDEVGAFQTALNNPLGPGEFLLFSVPMSANSIGEANFKGDPADISPFNDTLLFEPPLPVEIQEQRFVNSNTPSAPKLTHTLKITGDAGLNAVDNTFHVAANSSSNVLDVLANDFTNSPPLEITNVGTRSDGGTVLITNGMTRLTYTPRPGFFGTEQFTYTVRNGEGQSATATVTAQVGTSAKDINYRIETTNAAGGVISQVADGSTFQLRVYGQDLRTDDGSGNPTDQLGIFAAYMDLLFDSELVSTIPQSPTPGNPRNFAGAGGPEFDTNGLSGTAGINIINEYGAFQSSATPLGPDEQLLGIITLRAEGPGVAEFFVDPADISPLHDTLLFEPTDPVDIDRINLGLTSITITSGAGGEGEAIFQNPRNPYDVDNNGQVTPRDALLGVNRLNSVMLGGGGEGEAGAIVYYDVNGDGYQTPNDVLKVVNYLNNHVLSGAAAEGEGESFDLPAASEDLSNFFGGPSLIVSQPQYASQQVEATQPSIPATQPQVTQQPAVEDRDSLFADWDRVTEEREELELDALYQAYDADLAWSGGLKE